WAEAELSLTSLAFAGVPAVNVIRPSTSSACAADAAIVAPRITQTKLRTLNRIWKFSWFFILSCGSGPIVLIPREAVPIGGGLLVAAATAASATRWWGW